ncbi:Putative transposase [Bradyrhizobium sp. ORS 285]|uniref:hypothetical protein n=1 Tax=Bradyrhizobium sp. ORS 285 TaxID=115808 RepID=UPI0002407E5C|nr:hypothetical protein [Bradyrhizobium sp. ORS 285]CCD86198.1 fragment of transposase (part 2) [Bradyrhizobium sp. ORS 285]SMX61034.1 Putative transposase [Bradyrhizobium sp. ORS 285]
MTDPDSCLYQKARGKEARLSDMGHVTLENRNGLVIDGRVTHATGKAERSASEAMLKAEARTSGRRMTVDEDKAYDTAEPVAKLRQMNATPHVTQYKTGNANGRQSTINGRTTRHAGYGMFQTCPAMIECNIGWSKQHETTRKTKHRGCDLVLGNFLLNPIGYNPVRIPKLIAARGRLPGPEIIPPTTKSRPKLNIAKNARYFLGSSADCWVNLRKRHGAATAL